MQKTVPSFGRLLTMVLFALSCFGLLLFLWLQFGGPTPLKAKGYRVDALFDEATQLALQADVRVSGVPVGKVVETERDGSRTRATLEIERRYAPLPSDVRAVLRQKTLLGETYVELTPGTARAPKLRENATLAAGQVRPTVELDEVLRALDARSRRDLRRFLAGFDDALDGRAQDLNDSVGNVAPLAAEGRGVLETFDAEARAVRALVRDGGTVLGAIGARDAATRELVGAGRDVLQTTAARQDDLRATVRAVRPFLRALRGAAASTSSVSRDLLPAARDLRPVARRLPSTLRGAAALGDDLRGLSADLDPVLRAAEDGLPAGTRLLRLAGPLLDRLQPLGVELQPAAAFLEAYRAELTQSWAKVAAATQATAAGASGRKINYLRLTAPLWSEALAVAPERAPTNRANPYPAPGGLAKLADGKLESFDCAHVGNRGIPAAGSAPPCLQQQPFQAGDPRGATRFPRLRGASPVARAGARAKRR